VVYHGATVPWHAAIMRNSVLGELRVRRFADIQEEICFRAVWKWAICNYMAVFHCTGKAKGNDIPFSKT